MYTSYSFACPTNASRTNSALSAPIHSDTRGGRRYNAAGYPSLGAPDVAEQVIIRAGDGGSPAGSRSARSAVQYTSLGDQVYHVLWRQIVDRTLRPGDKISDVQ